MAISKKSWTGLAREATSGTAAATPTVFHPAKSKFTRKTKYVYLNEDRGTRDGNYGRKASVRQSTGSIDGAWYNDTSPYLLLGFMGALASSQPDSANAPTVYKHNLTLADVPPTLTVWHSYDVANYIFAYTAVEELQFKFTADGKLLDCNAKTISQYGTKNTGAAPTPSYSAVIPFAGYEPTIQLAGAQSQDIEDLTLTLKQKITAFWPAAGSQQFAKLYFGERTATFDFTARFDATSLADDFENDGYTFALDIDFKGDLIAATFNQELHLNFPICAFDDVDPDTSKDEVLVKCKGTAMPGTTPNSLFTADVTNTVTSYAQ